MKKHNTIKTLCLSALLLLGGLRASAQLEQSIFLNGSLPLGAMSSQLDNQVYADGPWMLGLEGAGTNATLGFGLGYRIGYRFDVGFGQMAPFVNVDFLWNQVGGEMREHNTILGYRSCNYFNLPAFVGLAYYYDGFDIFTPYLEAGLGYDFLFITPEGNKSDNLWLRYKVKNALAWQVGAGCYFGSHVSLSLHYYAMGKHYISISEKSQLPTEDWWDDCLERPAQVQTKPLSVGELLLRVGFHF